MPVDVLYSLIAFAGHESGSSLEPESLSGAVTLFTALMAFAVLVGVARCEDLAQQLGAVQRTDKALHRLQKHLLTGIAKQPSHNASDHFYKYNIGHHQSDDL